MIEGKLRKIWEAQPSRSPKNTFAEVFHIKFFVFNSKMYQMELISIHWHRLLLCYKFHVMQSFDFIKCNIIQKLACKVKFISLITGGLIMFFGNSRIRFLKISWLDCEKYGKNQCKKKEHNQHSSVFKMLR